MQNISGAVLRCSSQQFKKLETQKRAVKIKRHFKLNPAVQKPQILNLFCALHRLFFTLKYSLWQLNWRRRSTQSEMSFRLSRGIKTWLACWIFLMRRSEVFKRRPATSMFRVFIYFCVLTGLVPERWPLKAPSVWCSVPFRSFSPPHFEIHSKIHDFFSFLKHLQIWSLISRWVDSMRNLFSLRCVFIEFHQRECCISEIQRIKS